MTLRQHLFLSIALEFLGFLLGTLAGFYVAFVGFASGWPVPLRGIVAFVLAICGVMTFRILMRRVIGCRCTQDGCTGRMRQAGSRPIRYVCRTCDHEEETEVFEGDRGRVDRGL
jgi:hypothetical protein